MTCLYQIYTWYIPIFLGYHMSKRVRDWYGTNPESFFDVYTWVTTKMVICQIYTWYIPCIYLLNVYDRDIPCINMEYTQDMVYTVHTRYMSVLYLEVGAAAADMAPFLPIHPQ
jgi:hypothetical protein